MHRVLRLARYLHFHAVFLGFAPWVLDQLLVVNFQVFDGVGVLVALAAGLLLEFVAFGRLLAGVSPHIEIIRTFHGLISA